MKLNKSLKPSLSLSLVSDHRTFYEVRDENGDRYCHCGSMKDVERVLSLHPRFTYVPFEIDNSPTIIDVDSERINELLLNKSDLEELFS